MKKSKLLLVLASALLLTGCKFGGKSSEAPASSSGSESSGSESSSSSDVPSGQSFSFADIVSSFAAEGVTGVVIPNYEAASDAATCTYDTANGEFLLKGTTNAEMQAYAAALTAAGWNLTTDEYGDYSGVFGETRAQLWLEDWLDYSKQAIVLGFQLGPSSEFPSADVAAFLTANSWTDTIPAFSNEAATGYQFFSQGAQGQIAIVCAEDGEDALLALVKAFYLSEQGGSFVDGGEDANGYHLISPNAQFELVLWDYVSSYPGEVFINIQTYVAPAAEFPVATVNEFLTTYALGYQLSAEASYSGTAFSMDSGASSGYHYLMVTCTGGDYEAYKSLFGPIVTAAGYTQNTAITTMTFYSNADDHQLRIMPGEGYVTLVFFE